MEEYNELVEELRNNERADAFNTQRIKIYGMRMLENAC